MGRSKGDLVRDRPRVAIVGGGISGLATAYFLSGCRDSNPAPEVILIEADHRLGGKILTGTVAGLPVDLGSDASHLGAGPAGADRRVASARCRGRPRVEAVIHLVPRPAAPMPPGTVFGIPQRLLPLLRSGLLSPLGVLRAGGDLVLPRRRLPADPSVQQLLQPRFGAEVYHRLIDPLLGGVHAGRAHLLSATSAVPDITAVARRSRSIYWALRRRAARGPALSAGPVLAGFDGGLSRLIDALVAAISSPRAPDRAPGSTSTPGPAPVSIRTGCAVAALDRVGAGYRIELSDGSVTDADAVILATPAFAAARLLDRLLPSAASTLDEVPYADVASIILEYSPAAVGNPLDGTGFLVPPEEGKLLVGCTWLSAKWPYLAHSPTVLIRCSVGRHGDERWKSLRGDALIQAVHEELAGVLGLTEFPIRTTVQRWPAALPQYTVGHSDRLARIDAAVGTCPGLHLTGAAYRGVGLAGCVAQAHAVARAAAAGLSPTHPARNAPAGQVTR